MLKYVPNIFWLYTDTGHRNMLMEREQEQQ